VICKKKTICRYS